LWYHYCRPADGGASRPPLATQKGVIVAGRHWKGVAFKKTQGRRERKSNKAAAKNVIGAVDDLGKRVKKDRAEGTLSTNLRLQLGGSVYQLQ